MICDGRSSEGSPDWSSGLACSVLVSGCVAEGFDECATDVGDLVGLPEGFDECATVGIGVGDLVGLAEGFDECATVGIDVGTGVGDLVGKADGVAVGDLVGSDVSIGSSASSKLPVRAREYF